MAGAADADLRARLERAERLLAEANARRAADVAAVHEAVDAAIALTRTLTGALLTLSAPPRAPVRTDHGAPRERKHAREDEPLPPAKRARTLAGDDVRGRLRAALGDPLRTGYRAAVEALQRDILHQYHVLVPSESILEFAGGADVCQPYANILRLHLDGTLCACRTCALARSVAVLAVRVSGEP